MAQTPATPKQAPVEARKTAWSTVNERYKGGLLADLGTAQQLTNAAKNKLGNVWQGSVAEMAITIGLQPHEIELAGPMAEAAVAGVIAERRFGTNNVFNGHVGNLINTLKQNGHTQLAGKLTSLRADIKTAPSWNPVSLTDNELKKEITTNKAMAETLYWAAEAAPHVLAKAALQTASITFEKAAQKMGHELDRRKR